MFRGCEIDFPFLPSAPIGQSPVIAARFQGLRKYQHHLKSNACWPASSDSEDCDERNSLPDSKVAWGEYQLEGEELQVDDNRANLGERFLYWKSSIEGRALAGAAPATGVSLHARNS